MPTDLCFPVLRYSSATGTRADGTVPWTNLQSSDLFVIIKGTNTHCIDGELRMDIVQGSKVVDSVDIGVCIDAALRAQTAAAGNAGQTFQAAPTHILMATKNATVAIQYRQAGAELRRLQLRLQNATRCRQVAEAFVRRGIVVREPRPATAQAHSSRPSTAASQDNLLTEPSTLFRPEPEKVGTARHNPFKPQTLEAGSLSGLSEPPSSSSERPISRMAPPILPPPGTTSTFFVSSQQQPSTAMYRSNTLPSQPSERDVLNTLQQPPNVRDERPATSSQMHSLQALRDAAEGHVSLPDAHYELPPATLRQHLMSDQWSTNTDNPSTPEFHYSDGELPSSDTARPSTSASSGSRPGSSALSMPPLPKPKLVKGNSNPALLLNPTIGLKDAARPVTASPLKRAYAVSETDIVRPQTAVSASRTSTYETAIKTRQDGSRPESLLPSQHLAPQEPAKRRMTPMNELLFGRAPLAERSTNERIPRYNSLLDAPHEEITPPSSPERKALPAGSTTQDTDTHRVDAAISSTAHQQQGNSLKEYAAQSQSERQAALDDFMVAHLNDPAFNTLCEDIDNCWRRAALGL